MSSKLERDFYQFIVDSGKMEYEDFPTISIPFDPSNERTVPGDLMFLPFRVHSIHSDKLMLSLPKGYNVVKETKAIRDRLGL